MPILVLPQGINDASRYFMRPQQWKELQIRRAIRAASQPIVIPTRLPTNGDNAIFAGIAAAVITFAFAILIKPPLEVVPPAQGQPADQPPRLRYSYGQIGKAAALAAIAGLVVFTPLMLKAIKDVRYW